MESQQYPLVPRDAIVASHDATPPHGLNLGRVLRQRLLVGFLVFVILAPALAAWAWLSFQPTYVAEAIVQVNSVRPKVLYRTEDSASNASFSTFFNTQMVMLTSTTLLNRCLNDPAVSNSHVLTGAQDLVQALREALQVSNIPNTQYLSVKVRGEKAEGLAAVANVVVRTYMAYADEVDSISQNRKTQLLEAERKKLTLDVETKTAALSQSRASMASNPDASSGSLIRDPLSVTHEAIVGLRKEQASLQTRRESLRAAVKAPEVDIPGAVVAAAVDREPEVEPLMAIVGQLRREIALADFEAASPLMATVQARLNAELQIAALKQETARRELHVARLSEGPKAAAVPANAGDQESALVIVAEMLTDDPEGRELAELAIQLLSEGPKAAAVPANAGDQESALVILAELLADDPEGRKLAELAIQLQRDHLLLQAMGDTPSSAMVRERLDARPQIQALKGEMMRKEIELAAKAETLKETNPRMLNASAVLDGLRSGLAKAEAESRPKVVEELKQDAKQREKELSEQRRVVGKQLKPYHERALQRAKKILSALRERLAVLEPELKNGIVQEIKADAKTRAKELREQLASIQKQVQQRREQARATVVARLKDEARGQMERRLRELDSELAACASSEKELNGMVAKQVEQRVVAERERANVKTLEDDLGRTRQSLLGVEQRLHELEVEAGAPGYVSIASPATDPQFPEPYMQKRIKYGIFALIAAAGLALLAMILLDRRDDRIRCPEDLRTVHGAELLGCVPHWGRELRPAGRPALLCGPGAVAPRLVAEEVRNLMVNLLSPTDGHAVRTVLVTGAAPGNGRTTLAVNVAACIAGVGRKVLLVDASFRKPDVASLFGVPAAPGLGDLLAGGATVVEVVRDTAIPGLSVLPAGSPPVDTVGALGSETMRNALCELSGRFDHVLIDGPPLMLADARILAPMVDGVVCALRASSSRRAVASECLATLRRLGARVLGLVLMGVRQEHNGYAATAAALHSYARAGHALHEAQIVDDSAGVGAEKKPDMEV